jgi:hypothetical protein
MIDLFDDECNLLRYYAETDRILHGPVLGAVHQHLRSGLGATVGSRKLLLLFFCDMIRQARQTRGGVSGATAVRQLG